MAKREPFSELHSSYDTLSFTEFTEQYKALYESNMVKVRLFELTLPWLAATKQFMLPEHSEVIVHCLYQQAFEHKDSSQERVLIIAWPLVHSTNHSNKNHDNKHQWSKQKISSLTSFYAAVSEPIFVNSPNKKAMRQLLADITRHHPWSSMQLGAFETGVVTQALREYFPYQRLYSQTVNVYQEALTDYASYYQQRPSQLRNTIKRREKKLAKAHQYHTDIITDIARFPEAFNAYKSIYQQSWKGEEYSFDFIEQVCLAALTENKLRLGLLFVDDEPAAAQLWFLQNTGPKLVADVNDSGSVYSQKEGYQKTASIFKLAYSPKYQQYSVGSILSLVLSEHVISEDKVTTIEFGMGAEPYKKDWLSDTRVRQSYQVFNPQSIYGKLAIIRHMIIPSVITFVMTRITNTLLLIKSIYK
ncbi:GNAT family N-acetyltransferase [Colwellia ponticola]|uniref:GNAT family N-acetyltransferase n=1 Tax=Colwellia ponticola TaxID=2304625 RepID=A0A8H2PMU9_9GAMM|nr:GNAT family N-acetyltransferase [Colwellia ponticola]TMM45633.1 GNAT family N-acetyltransferase [Colwellia ponticola]